MLKNQIVKRTAAVGLAAGLALTSIAAAGAQEATPTTPVEQGYIGSVASYDGSTLVIDTVRPDTSEVTLAVDDQTVIKTPGGPDIAGTLAEGASVAVLGKQEADGSWTALDILVKPTAPLTQAVSGAVVSKDGDVLTIQMPNGETRQLQLGPNETAPEVGDVVTAFARHGAGGGQPQVTGMQRADEVRARLQGFLDDMTSDQSNLPDAVAAARANIASRLVDVLQRFTQRHADMLQQALSNENLPSQARDRLQTALNNAQQRMQDVMDRIQQMRDQMGMSGQGHGSGNMPGGTPEASETPESTQGQDSSNRPTGTPEASETPESSATETPSSGQ